MNVFSKAFVVALTIGFAYLLLGKIPYVGSQKDIGTIDGYDASVPYNERYGILGYAHARDYYEDFEIVERRITSFSPFKLALSLGIIIQLWVTLMRRFGT